MQRREVVALFNAWVWSRLLTRTQCDHQNYANAKAPTLDHLFHVNFFFTESPDPSTFPQHRLCDSTHHAHDQVTRSDNTNREPVIPFLFYTSGTTILWHSGIFKDQSQAYRVSVRRKREVRMNHCWAGMSSRSVSVNFSSASNGVSFATPFAGLSAERLPPMSLISCFPYAFRAALM